MNSTGYKGEILHTRRCTCLTQSLHEANCILYSNK